MPVSERLKTNGRVVCGGRGQLVSPGRDWRRRQRENTEKARRSVRTDELRQRLVKLDGVGSPLVAALDAAASRLAG